LFLPSCSATVLAWSGVERDVSEPALPFAALWLAPAVVPAAGVLEAIESVLTQGLSLVQDGYQRAPALVLVFSALLVLPVVAVISFVVHSTRRRRRREAALRAAQRRADAGVKDMPGGAGAPAWPSQAWLTIEGARGGTMPLAGQVIRIGRHEDNDIRLADSSVHRHHAVIERTPEEAFVIIDVSGKEGNGVRINGARTAQAQLADGDVIELGRAKLKFETAPL
jgi:hypothetical protein